MLAAGFMIQKNNYLAYFDNVELVKTLVGVTRHIVYECIDRLQKRGLIALKGAKQRRRRFHVTEKGMSAIRCYTQKFNYSVALYQENINPGLFK